MSMLSESRRCMKSLSVILIFFLCVSASFAENYDELFSFTGAIIVDERDTGEGAIGFDLSGVMAIINASLKVSHWGGEYPNNEDEDSVRVYLGYGALNPLQFQLGYGTTGTLSLRLKSEIPLSGLWGDSLMYENRGRAWYDRIVVSAYAETYLPDIQYGIGVGVHIWSPE